MFIYTHTNVFAHAIYLDVPENITGVRSTTMNVKKTLATIPLYYEHAICTFIIKAIANFKFFFYRYYPFRVIYKIIFITFGCDHSSSHIIIIIYIIFYLPTYTL